MKLVSKGSLPQLGLSGEVKLLPETVEDLWHTYNLLILGDEISAAAIRKVSKESSTGSVDSQRVRVTLRVRLQSIDFDPEGGELRLGGVVTNEVEGVRLGSHHTLTLELHRPFAIAKDEWDSVALERVREATEGQWSGADLAAVLIKEGTTGALANVCLISAGMSVVRARLEANAFPKQGDARIVHGAKKSREQWFKQVLEAVLRHVDFQAVKCIVLAGPGRALSLITARDARLPRCAPCGTRMRDQWPVWHSFWRPSWRARPGTRANVPPAPCRAACPAVGPAARRVSAPCGRVCAQASPRRPSSSMRWARRVGASCASC